ncbi:hypothetical protein [Flavobacterium sp.]|uniref:hypothetical protein n=1 Tax=Flavobacterium sp. TaxID=239 RepID=UPI0037515A9C
MVEFANKEIEIYDKLINLIGGHLVTIEFNTKDKSKLEYLLCSSSEEKQKVTKKKVKKFKKEVDNCREEIAGYLLALADIFDNGQYYLEKDDVTKNFLSDYYDDLVQILVKENFDISEITDLEFFIISSGYDYQLIEDYIFGVSHMYFYQYYKLCLDTLYENLIPDEIESQNKKKSISDITKTTILKEEQNLDNISTFNKNLSNDPLFEKTNEYTNLKSAFTEGYKSRTAHYPDIDYLFEVNDDLELKKWEETEKEKLNNTFLKMVKDLNHKKTFFFGCSFANYEYNYPIRLNQFLENFYDATELEFINEELEFLENIIYDLQNSESAHDGYSHSGIDNFLKAYDVISITDYKQYLFSHNKKVEFLEFKKANFNVIKPIIKKSIDLIELVTTNPHPQVFANLKAFQLFEKLHQQFKDSNNKMADFSFIYRKMYNDSYILNHFKPQMFIVWINTEPYNISLDKIKTLNDCSTTQKVNTYTTTKELMQLN